MRGRTRTRRPKGEETSGTLTRRAGRSRSPSAGSEAGILIASNAEGTEGLPYLTRSNLAKTLNNQTPLLTFNANTWDDAPPIEDRAGTLTCAHSQPQAVVYDLAQITNPDNRSNPQAGDPAPMLAATSRQAVVTSCVRRFTPLECERLQGFPDGYTAVPFRGKPASDSARYAALGNSMAVPVFRWIGERIAAVDSPCR